MTSPKLRLLIGFYFGLTLGSAVAANPSVAKEAMPQSSGMEKLMGDLDNESFGVREEASRELWKIGEKALPLLKELATSKNPEQAIRARELIRKIELDVSPDSDPELIELIQSYPKSAASDKPKILNRLRQIQAWRQMLRLYAAETDQKILHMYAKSVHQIALFAAREQLKAGNPDAARELLELAPANAETLMALADFHRGQGTLNAELERNRNRPGKQAASWRLALYRASGDLVSARREAELANEPKIAAALAAMSGDPIPWLNLMAQNPSNSSDVIEQCYARVAIARWHGERPDSQSVERLKATLDDRNIQTQSAARNALFLLAQNETAEASMVKQNPIAAFWHYNSLERIDDALQILDLDVAGLKNPEWVKKRVAAIDQLTFENENQRNPKNELLAFAAFMEARGMQQEVYDLFVAPLLQLAVKDEDTFLDFLTQLKGEAGSNTCSPILAKKIALQWAGEDADKWISLISALFADDEVASNCWSWLPTLKPGASRQEYLDGLYALMGFGPDPDGLRDRWLAIAWKQVDQAPEDEKKKIRQKMAPLVLESNDVTQCLRLWDQDDELRGQVYWGTLVMHLSAMERWQEAAKIITDQIKHPDRAESNNAIEYHALAATALRNAGLNDEAKPHEEILETLILGDPNLALQIGNGYAFGNDYQRAEIWWERSIRYASPDSNQFVASALHYSDHHLLNPKRWAQTAALAEIICALLNSSEFRWENSLLAFMRQRMKSDLCRGLSLIESDREQGIRVLDQLHTLSITEGGLADYFFPAVRMAGLNDELERWFASTWQKMGAVLGRFPNATNTRNSTAWFAARAQRKLEPAEKYITGTLALYPQQSAYLDTMAEIQFAKGDRKSAIDWSRKSILLSPEDKELRQQYQHYKKDPLPSKR